MAGSEKETKEAIKQQSERDFYFDNIKRLHEQSESGIKLWSTAVCDERLAKLQRDFRNLETKVKQILCAGNTNDAVKKATNAKFNEAELLMFGLVDKLKTQQQQLQAKAVTCEQTKTSGKASTIESNEINDKRIEIEPKEKFVCMKFFGDMKEWDAYKRWLEEKVDKNDRFDSSKKLEIFIDSIKCTKVEAMLDNLDNFHEAKQELYDIFDSSYKVTQQNLRVLHGIQPLRSASSESILALIKAVDDRVRIFKAKIPNNYEVYVTLATIDKLDAITTVAWERHLKAVSKSWAQSENKSASDYMPDWPTLRDFLKAEAEIYMSIDSNVVNYSYKANKSVNEAIGMQKNKGDVSCFFCHSNHQAKKCPAFLNGSIEQRVKQATDNKLCLKCIMPIHPNKPCRDEKCNNHCPKCGESTFHNSLFCPNAYHTKVVEEEDWS